MTNHAHIAWFYLAAAMSAHPIGPEILTALAGMTNDMVRSYNLESRGTGQGRESIWGRNMMDILVSRFAKNSRERLRKVMEEHATLEQTT